MIQSMTGYGKATAELSDKKINVEIKSLNSKAMDLSARIAPLYREKEMQIRNEISKMLERGKVDFSLWIEKKDAEQMATPINQDLVEAYYKRIKEISAAAGIPEPADWFATLLCTTRRTTRGGDRESQIQLLRQQIVNDSGLSRTGRGGEYNQFTHLWYLLFDNLLFNALTNNNILSCNMQKLPFTLHSRPVP